jgi:hypothetical protein
MATLEEALGAGPSARLDVAGGMTVVVTQDLDGECAVSVRQGGGAQAAARRFATVAEVRAYLASGAVPGVRGDERGWVA